MDLNLWAILVCAVAAMVLGSIWYGPLFGKMWMRLCGMSDMDAATRKDMQKKAMPLYFVQFVITLIQLFVLSYLTGSSAVDGMLSAVWVWIGFVFPTVAATSMWTGEPRRMAWTRFGIQASYQLVSLVMFGAILGAWN